MFIKENNGQFIFADESKSLKYQKSFDKEIIKKDEEGKEYAEIIQELKNVVVFNPQPQHFIEAGYKELIMTDLPEIEMNQYIETVYELKEDKYYEVHNIVEMSNEVNMDE